MAYKVKPSVDRNLANHDRLCEANKYITATAMAFYAARHGRGGNARNDDGGGGVDRWRPKV